MKKSFCCIIMLCVCFVVILSYTYTVNCANESIADIYGLTVTSKTSQLMLLNDKIAVFSPNKSSLADNPGVSAADISSCIKANGYTVSYADTEKNDNTTEMQIFDGYVKLTPNSMGEVVYIPIVTKVPIDKTFETMYDGGASNGSSVTYSETTGGIGGKRTDDTSCLFNVNGTITETPLFCIQSGTFQYDKSTAYSHAFTYVFNVYADGDAVAKIASPSRTDTDANAILEWLPDGTIKLDDYKDNTTSAVKEFGTLERGKWHTIAITYNPSRSRMEYWIDGERISLNGSYVTAAMMSSRCFYFGVSPKSGKGRVAYDDLEAYWGVYNEKNGYKGDRFIELESSSHFVSIEANTIEVSGDYSGDLMDLLDTFTTNADEYEIYADEKMKDSVSESSKLKNGSIVVLRKTDISSYKYYKIALPCLELREILFNNQAENMIGANAKVVFSGSKITTPVTMIMVQFDENNRMISVLSTETVDVGANEVTFEIAPVVRSGKYAEVFFINSWKDPKWLFNKIFREE